MTTTTRTHLPSLLALLALTGCSVQGETGIDRTFITGTVTMPPQAYTETEADPGSNDTSDAAAAEDLGFTGYRYVQASGSCHTFGADGPDGDPNGDFDWYRFTPIADGDVTVSLTFDGGTAPVDTGDKGDETVIYQVTIHEMDGDTEVAPALVDEQTADTFGAYSTTIAVSAGTTYAIRVAGRRNLGESDTYLLQLSSFNPNDASFIVGAYLSPDIADRGRPVGGSDVREWVLDEETLTWSTDYLMTFISEVTTCEPDDTECNESAPGYQAARTVAPAPDTGDTADTGKSDTGTTDDTGGTGSGETTGTDDTGGTGSDDTGGSGSGDEGGGDEGGGDEGGGDEGGGDEGGDDGASPSEELPHTYVNIDISTVYVFAGTFTNLNAGLSSKVHYSSESTEVSLTDTDKDEVGKQVSADPVVIDTVQPVLYGWSVPEVEPNTVAFDGAAITTAEAQALGEASGPGFIDTITGSLDYEADDPQYTGENDAFSFTVPVSSTALITAGWPDDAYNSDVYVFDSDGNTLGAGWSIADVNPEVFHMGDDWGVTFEPGVTYYIAIFPWSGPAGAHEYTIEIEWQ